MNLSTDNKTNPSLQIITSESVDPWYNLALEEYLFNTISDNSIILYLWQNKNTVVIGKSQNAWKECRVSALEADGGKLARRPSGGGAVYHDLGNMCYTFIASSGLYNLERQLAVILNAVKSQNIAAKFTGRNDIVTSDGRKFSGNAFRFSGDKGLMHGTLLLDTDSEKMARYLQVSPAKMKAKGVNSVRSRVVNLIELNPQITPECIKSALKVSFYDEFGNSATEHSFSPENTPSEVYLLYEKYASWQWRMGETPEFAASFETRFSWGCIEIAFNANKGIIQNIEIYTDAMDADLSSMLKNSLQGCKLSYDEICVNIRASVALMASASFGQMLADPSTVSEDLCEWFREIL